MNPRTRQAALYAIGAIAILASANALAHSYAGLYDWAVHHRLTGRQAMSWPAEIDVFLAVGELALYVAYLDGWPVRQRIWPWTTALVGLSVSIAGNIGHIQSQPGHPVILADRLTAATSPIAAFAGLTVGLLVLKMTRLQDSSPIAASAAPAQATELAPSWLPALAADGMSAADQWHDPAGHSGRGEPSSVHAGTVLNGTTVQHQSAAPAFNGDRTPRTNSTADSSRPPQDLLREATAIYRTAAANGERLSQRTLASRLRGHGHRFSNQHLHTIAASIGLLPERASSG